jgi:hypothetical protein
MRNKITSTHRGPPCDCLDIVRETIITVGGMEASYGRQVLEDMVRQICETVISEMLTNLQITTLARNGSGG